MLDEGVGGRGAVVKGHGGKRSALSAPEAGREVWERLWSLHHRDAEKGGGVRPGANRQWKFPAPGAPSRPDADVSRDGEGLETVFFTSLPAGGCSTGGGWVRKGLL